MHYTYRTKGTCSAQIDFDINGNIITNIDFLGGCNGNLKAISKLVDGWTVDRRSNRNCNRNAVVRMG